MDSSGRLAVSLSNALTIPAISIYSILTNQHVALGLDAKEMAFIAITFVVASFTLSTGKIFALKGVLHLILLFAYLALPSFLN